MKSPEVSDPLSQIQTGNFQVKYLPERVVLLLKEKEIPAVIPSHPAKTPMIVIMEEAGTTLVAEEKLAVHDHFREKIHHQQADRLLEMAEIGINQPEKKVQVAEIIVEQKNSIQEKINLSGVMMREDHQDQPVLVKELIH